MFKKLTIIMCLLSFFPAAVGAQELAALQQVAPAAQQSGVTQVAKEVDLSLPVARQAATIMAANDAQGTAIASERPRKSHTGLSFQEFCEVHFGEYRWIYWVGAAAVLVAIHVAAAD